MTNDLTRPKRHFNAVLDNSEMMTPATRAEFINKLRTQHTRSPFQRVARTCSLGPRLLRTVGEKSRGPGEQVRATRSLGCHGRRTTVHGQRTNRPLHPTSKISERSLALLLSPRAAVASNRARQIFHRWQQVKGNVGGLVIPRGGVGNVVHQ